MKIKESVVRSIESFKLHWKHTPHGKYMSYKEIVSLSVGGMGIKFIFYAVQTMILSVGNTLIGNTIGISPRPLYIIYLISVLISFPLTAIRANIIDNSRNKKGKYRPYIFTMAVPTVILAIGFTWMPYDSMSMFWKCFTVLLYNIGFQFFYMFVFNSYESIINVLSPNTYERSDVCSIKSVTDSFAPTIVGILFPLLARMITGENTIYDMKIYRVIYPPILILGLALAIFIHVNTEEKIVQAKTHVIHIKVTDAMRAIARNKYFWILSLAGWLGFLEASFGTLLGWLYNYQAACSAGQYSLITAIYGNSSLWSMLFAPVLIRKIGKRNLLIFSNLMSIFFILMMYPVVTKAPNGMMIWLLLGCMFINGLVTSLGNILAYSLNGDVRDYQHYISGERIDGMFMTIGLIGSVVTLATSFVLPEIYDFAGLNETVALSLGYNGSNVYDVLYNTEYFHRIAGVLILASVIGAVLNVIPYFFYDLTETNQKAMVTVLKIRALFEDYGNDALSDEALVEAIDIIEKSKEDYEKTPNVTSKNSLKLAKKQRNKTLIRAARKEIDDLKEENIDIEIAKYVIKEINKFETQAVTLQVKKAEIVYSQGLNGLRERYSKTALRDAKYMPKNSEEEKEIRKAAIESARKEKSSYKTINKYFKDGIQEFDNSIFTELFNYEDRLNAEIKEAYSELHNNKKHNSSEKSEIRLHIASLKQQRRLQKAEIKRQTNLNSIYNRAAQPYVDAKKLLIQKENYSNFEAIKAHYEESKLRAEEAEAVRVAMQKKEEKKAYTTKLKEERKSKK